MTNQHPIAPLPEKVDQWFDDAVRLNSTSRYYIAPRYYIARQAALWSADQELEACITWLDEMQLAGSGDIEVLRAARRPKPLSLRAQALIEFDSLLGDSKDEGAAIILRALEALPND
jgi:hypothetical protein